MSVKTLVSRAIPSPGLPDPVAAGKVLATLSDVQAIYYTLIFVIVCLIGLAVYALGRSAASEKAGREMAQKFADAADKVADATKDSDTQIAVQLALIQSELREVGLKLDDLRRKGR